MEFEFTPILFAIPFVAAFIGWSTNWVAVKALMYPVEFVGIPPFLGWQGVLPKNAEEMGLSFGRLFREKLIDIDQLFADMKNQDNEQLDKLADEITEKIIHEFSTNVAADAWGRAREKLRAYITSLVHENVRTVVDEILERFGQQAEEIIDIDEIVREAMVRERALMGRILAELAGPEFDFIVISGLYFGFIFGIFQMFIWIIYPAYWVLPAAGFFVGYATNWMAMNLIFEPKEPIKIGPFTIQGVFIKRQTEFAVHFADVFYDKVFYTKNLIKHLGQGKSRLVLMGMIEEQVDSSMAMYESDPMVVMLASKEKLADAREDMRHRIRNADLEQEGPIHTIINQTSTMREQIITNIRALNSTEFSGILRQVFQKDEWKLLLVGGVLGIIIGGLQYVFLFGGSF